MHSATFKMKDGTVHCGPINKWRPKEGWCSLMGYNPDLKLWFRDVKEAGVVDRKTIHSTKVSPMGEPIDLLAKAKEDGWDGT